MLVSTGLRTQHAWSVALYLCLCFPCSTTPRHKLRFVLCTQLISECTSFTCQKVRQFRTGKYSSFLFCPLQLFQLGHSQKKIRETEKVVQKILSCRSSFVSDWQRKAQKFLPLLFFQNKLALIKKVHVLSSRFSPGVLPSYFQECVYLSVKRLVYTGLHAHQCSISDDQEQSTLSLFVFLVLENSSSQAERSVLCIQLTSECFSFACQEVRHHKMWSTTGDTRSLWHGPHHGVMNCYWPQAGNLERRSEPLPSEPK